MTDNRRGGYWVGPGYRPEIREVRSVVVDLDELPERPLSEKDVIVMLVDGLEPFLRCVGSDNALGLAVSDALRVASFRTRWILRDLLDDSLALEDAANWANAEPSE